MMGGGCRLEKGQVWRVSVLRDPRSRWIGARGPPLLSGAERKRPSGPFCSPPPYLETQRTRICPCQKLAGTFQPFLAAPRDWAQGTSPGVP